MKYIELMFRVERIIKSCETQAQVIQSRLFTKRIVAHWAKEQYRHKSVIGCINVDYKVRDIVKFIEFKRDQQMKGLPYVKCFYKVA